MVTEVSGDLRLSWATVAGASGYTAQVSADPSFTTLLQTAATYGLDFVPGVTLGGSTDTLYWRVAAHETGTSEATRGAWTTVESDRPTLSKPALVSPTDAVTIDYPSPVSFAWSSVPGAVGYELQYSSDPDFPTSASTTTVVVVGSGFTPQSALARESDGLPITWYWRVRAKFFTASSTVERVGPYSAVRTFQVRWTPAASTPSLVAPAADAWGSEGLLQGWLTLHLWDEVPLDGCHYAQEVPA